ncbi:hypothetical protein [Mitsuaria sp. TWR114]|uniref:hypothetical protein n=1 Tax=Mitsuaria sp. TWR114 TaxID=2601731 RepID=UPI002106ACFD|nr:hypothetical protein [Mitsuaria sp. TWR114]
MTETTTGRASASLRWTLSAKGADLASSTRLAAQPDLALQPVAQLMADAAIAGMPKLVVNSARRFQRIEGFGAPSPKPPRPPGSSCRPPRPTRCCRPTSTSAPATATPSTGCT